MIEKRHDNSANKKIFKLLLISPYQKYVNYQAHVELAKIFRKKRLMTSLALPLVAGLTPSNYEIKIIDEEIESILINFKPDIVGITTLSATVNRAYELADMFRSEGVKVVLGGPYASFNTEEGLKHADSIVVGEAETTWPNCLNDFETGNMRRIYEAKTMCEYKTSVKPRWDLIPTNKIFQVAVQATRGCPFNCHFCLVSELFGRKMRYRDLDNVIDEIKNLPNKWIFFVDDNFTINKKYARELMHKIKPLGISWACQSSIDVADDEELLKDMAESGCYNILIGFESLNSDSLEETNKLHNKNALIYKKAVQTIHKYGIHINASFVVGFDNDKLDEFDKIYEFTKETGLGNVNLHVLSAVPGTQLYRNLKEENRLPNLSSDLGVGFLPNLNYMNMTRVELFDKYMETIIKLYSWDTLNEKAKIIFSSGAFKRAGLDVGLLLKLNMIGILFFEFILSTNKGKRKLFKTIFNLMRKKLLSKDKGFGYLMYMLGVNRHINMHKKRLDEYRSLLKN